MSEFELKNSTGFSEDPNCETPGTCARGKVCQRALLINQEVAQETDQDRTGVMRDPKVLESVVYQARCEHPDVKAAIEEATPVIMEPDASVERLRMASIRQEGLQEVQISEERHDFGSLLNHPSYPQFDVYADSEVNR